MDIKKRKRNRLRTIWYNMKSRCYNPQQHGYSIYGAKGIKVCDEWLSNFENFKNWALSNGYQEGLTIERLDNNKNYEPSNCKWATALEQANNTANNNIITYRGITSSLANICRLFDKDYLLVNCRIQKGWSYIDALDYPKGAKRKNSKYITYNGETKTLTEWTKLLGFKKNTLNERLRMGWSIVRAFNQNVRRRDVDKNGSK